MIPEKAARIVRRSYGAQRRSMLRHLRSAMLLPYAAVFVMAACEAGGETVAQETETVVNTEFWAEVRETYVRK